MKIIKQLVFIAFITLTAFTCSSDDDSSGDDDTTSENKAKIIGTWKFTSSTINGTPDDLDPCELLDTVLFTSTQFTQTIFEGENCETSEAFTFNYNLNGNTISITVDGETFSQEITTLNSTTLTLKETEGSNTYLDTYTKQ